MTPEERDLLLVRITTGKVSKMELFNAIDAGSRLINELRDALDAVDRENEQLREALRERML